MEQVLRDRLEQALAEVDEHGTRGPRLLDDAKRLWARVVRFIEMKLIGAEPDRHALELACFVLQIPQRRTKLPRGNVFRPTLKQRAEQAAELMATELGDQADEALLERVSRLLHDLPLRQPLLKEAQLLADAINLDDFGMSGLVQLMTQITLQGGGGPQLLDAYDKRDQYGYWDARLKEGFHSDAIRDLARLRLQNARDAIALLASESKEDSL